MVTTLNFKPIIDLPKWRPLASTPAVQSTFSSGLVLPDFRNNEDRYPLVFLNSGGFSAGYNVKTDGWSNFYSGLSGAAGTQGGATMPAQGPRGTLAGGSTTTNIILSTALPAAVAVNGLADRGDGRGFKIRIIGNAAGSSGKIDEKIIVANTAGTTPTITLDSPLSFTPILGDHYEFLSGKMYCVGSTNTWVSADFATGAVTSLANVPQSVGTGDFNLIPLDELYVPYDQTPGSGFFGNLVATATGASSLTGQAVGGDAGIVINQYRNFQIRIVQDTGTPTSVGQRRNITSHTAGPSPVYTVPAWSVQPSATATYVIENNGDRMILWVAGSTNTLTYTISTNSWDTNITFSVRPDTNSAGAVAMQSFGIEPDLASPPNARHSFIFNFTGSGTAYTSLDIFDIAGAATGTWTTGVTINNPCKFTWSNLQGTGYTYDPATNQGRYIYIWPNSGTATFAATGTTVGQEFFRFDMKNRTWENFVFRKFPQALIAAGSSAIGNHLTYTLFIDGNTKLGFIMHIIMLNFGATTVGPHLLFFGCPITM